MHKLAAFDLRCPREGGWRKRGCPVSLARPALPERAREARHYKTKVCPLFNSRQQICSWCFCAGKTMTWSIPPQFSVSSWSAISREHSRPGRPPRNKVWPHVFDKKEAKPPVKSRNRKSIRTEKIKKASTGQMSRRLQIVSVLLERALYRSRAEVKRALTQRGLTTKHGIVRELRYWRVPQSMGLMEDNSFTIGRKINGVRLIRAMKKSQPPTSKSEL